MGDKKTRELGVITHLACIMDGNRRWAAQRGLPSWAGHREGVVALERTVKFCLAKGIAYLTVYAFSIENFNRSLEEKQYLFGILAHEIERTFDQQNTEWQVRISFAGDESLCPESVRPIMQRMQEKTAHHTKLHVHILIAYGGRQEIAHVAKRIAQQVQEGSITIDDITPEQVRKNLWLQGVPDPDLIIRTGGQQRLSNFLLYQCAYSELYFSETYWPAITDEELEKACEFFALYKRNFGK